MANITRANKAITTRNDKATKLLEEAHRAHLVIHGQVEALLERAFEAGENLVAAKELVPFGQWTARLEAAQIPPRSASKYMALARERERIVASGATGINEALRLIADRIPPRPRATTNGAGPARRAKPPTDRYAEGYDAGYRAGRADGFEVAKHGRAKDNGQPSQRDLMWLIKLAHPDLHQDDPHGVLAATRVTTWLNELRKAR
jgi:hypothetical protein